MRIHLFTTSSDKDKIGLHFNNYCMKIEDYSKQLMLSLDMDELVVLMVNGIFE